MFTKIPNEPYTEPDESIQNITPYFSKMYFNIIVPPTPSSAK
jgi:hypothetical protein